MFLGLSLGWWIGIAVGTAVAAGGMTTAISSGVQAQQQADIEEFNAKLAQRNAEQANANAAAQEENANRSAEAQMAETRRAEQIERENARRRRSINAAIAGSSGLEQQSGSSLLVAMDNAVTDELNALEVRRQGQVKADQIIYQGQLNAFDQRLAARGYQGEALNHRLQSNAYSRSVTPTILGGSLNALGSGVASGVSTTAGLKQSGVQ